MNTTARFFYGKEDKLKSRKLIEKLFRSGRSVSDFPLKASWLLLETGAPLKAGVGVSSRYHKKATDRNRIKRLIREAYRLQKNTLKDHLVATGKSLIIFILFTGKEVPAYELVYEKTGTLLNKLVKITDEKTAVLP